MMHRRHWRKRDMRKEDLRLAAGLTTNMIANMGKEGKNISMDTLVRICETLDCGILDVIELASDEPSVTEKKKTKRITKTGLIIYLWAITISSDFKLPEKNSGNGCLGRMHCG